MKVQKISACGPWSLIAIDPVPKEVSNLILYERDNKVDTSICGTGKVISIGLGELRSVGSFKKRFIVGVGVGDRILFRRYLQGAQRLDAWLEGKQQFCFLHKQDIIAKITKSDVVGIYSTAMKERKL